MTNRPAQDATVVPIVQTDLLDYLKRMYRDESPSRTDTIDDIRHKAGQVSVVRHLAEIHRKQNENILASPAKTSRVSRKQT